MYLTRWDDNLHLHANVSMGNEEIDKIVTILNDATKFI